MTFKLDRARDQTRIPWEFVANQFSDSRDIRRKPRFCLWWPWPLTLTFKLVRRDRTQSLWIWRSCANKKVTDSAKNRTLRSSLRAAKTIEPDLVAVCDKRRGNGSNLRTVHTAATELATSDSVQFSSIVAMWTLP